MSADHENLIDEFVAITSADRDIAKSLLDVCNHNLEMAINMHMEGVQTEDVGRDSQPGTSSSAAAWVPDEDEGTFIMNISCLFMIWIHFLDGVRAPIPQKQEVLVQPGYEGYALNRSVNLMRGSRVRSVFDGFRNFSNEARKFGLLTNFRHQSNWF